MRPLAIALLLCTLTAPAGAQPRGFWGYKLPRVLVRIPLPILSLDNWHCWAGASEKPHNPSKHYVWSSGRNCNSLTWPKGGPK